MSATYGEIIYEVADNVAWITLDRPEVKIAFREQTLDELADAFGYGLDDMEWLTLNAMKSAFWPFEQRLRIINEQIKPGYARLRAAEL